MKPNPRFAAVLIAVVCLAIGAAYAAPRVQALALFPGKAMLSIDGTNRLLRAGQRSPEGVLLVSANATEAVVEIGGERLKVRPGGGGVRSTFVAPRQREVRIQRDNRGSYRTPGSINGRSVDFLVDTGATSIALSEAEGRRLGIPFELEGTRVRVGTASGNTMGWSIVLDEVRVGEIVERNVTGIVIERTNHRRVLLGMTFINRLEFDNQGNLMVLRQRF